MNAKFELTATIKDAKIMTMWGDRVAVGHVYGDVKRRFEDGKLIHTSKIVKGPKNSELGHGIVKTQSGNYYKLEMAE